MKRAARRWPLVAAAAVAGLILGSALGASGSTKGKTVAGPAVTTTATAIATATVTTTPTKVIATHTATVRVTYTPPPVNALTDGTWVVGKQVVPGVYSTDGKSDSGGCYYARLSSFTSSDIIDNGNLTGPTTIEVAPSDKALELSGGCTWSKTG